MFNAFLDRKDLVRIESDKQYDQFWLWDLSNTYDYRVLSVYPVENHYVYELELAFEVDLSVRYYVYNQRGNKEYLIPRGVLKTSWFNEMYHTDASLGSFYTSKETTFKVWAPLASTVMVVLDSPGRKYKQSHLMQKLDHGVWGISIAGDYEGWSYVYLVKNYGYWEESVDPYSKASKLNSTASVVMDPAKVTVPMNQYPIDTLPMDQAIIYELHVRDFSINPADGFIHKGKFLAFGQSGLVNAAGDPIGLDYLKSLGITHVQLMPIFDFSSVTDFEFDTFYNWGYDPEQLQVLEGRYSTDPECPYSRIIELKEMVNTLKANGIGVILDVVYNHVHHVDTFSFEKLVPGYYFRTDDHYQLVDGSGCGNDVATEHSMVSRYLVDTLAYFTEEFKINGYRFDLMGLIDIETMKQVNQRLHEINPNIYLYGEGWQMPTGIPSSQLMNQHNADQIPNIGFFNDSFRDLVKGSTFNTQELGLASGNTYMLGACYRVLTAGIEDTYLYPVQSINYVSCHDDLTLYDRFYKVTQDPILIRHYQRLAFGFVLLSQGVPFFHGGSEFSRSKNGNNNSYNASDEINRIDWRQVTTEKELVDWVKKLISIRKHHAAFRLTEPELIRRHVHVGHDGRMIHYHINHVDFCSPYKHYHVIFNITSHPQDVVLEDDYERFNMSVAHTETKVVNQLTVGPYGIEILVK